MKHKLKAAAAAAAVLTAVVSAGAAMASTKSDPISTAEHSAAAPVQTDPSPAAAKYTVKVFGGRMAVYLTAHPDTPQYVTDVEVSTLPSADRIALHRGIAVYSEQELTSLLEDYSS